MNQPIQKKLLKPYSFIYRSLYPIRGKKMKQLFVVIIGILFLSFQLKDHVDYVSGLIPTKTGAIFAFTSEENSFLLHLESENIQPLEARNFVQVDNWVFQAFNLEFENPKNVDLKIENEMKKSLSQYVMYEIDYFKNELQIQCDSLKLNWGKINDKYFYFWYFNMPDTIENISKQMYLTTICHNQFLNMSIPIEKDSDFKSGKDFLFKVAKTLEINDFPVSFEELNRKHNE